MHILSNEEKEKSNRFLGKSKNSNGSGIKLPKPDKVEEHTLEVSPISGLPLVKPIGLRVKLIIDFLG